MSPPPPCGVLIVDKPRGPTSHDVVARVRRAFGTREVGHAGTLDPMATGVLVVAIGEATKLVPWLLNENKSYEARIALGVETDTLDAEGRETRRSAPGDALLQALARSPDAAVPSLLDAALAAERARTTQVPPAFSAIQQAGERAHVRARRGDTVDLPAREVRVARLELVGRSLEPATVEVSLEVGKGYYVRALARDLAGGLGTVGHLVALRRTRSGCFGVDEATAIDAPAEQLAARVQSLSAVAARVLPVARMTDVGATDARHGRRVRAEDLDGGAEGPSAWLDSNGNLVAIGEISADGLGRVLRGFSPASR
jgi:tRNA pseudouridine55 synthase